MVWNRDSKRRRSKEKKSRSRKEKEFGKSEMKIKKETEDILGVVAKSTSGNGMSKTKVKGSVL